MKLFITAFLQVAFVSANTYFLSQVNYTGALVCGFAISWLWSSNVRKVAIGGTKDTLAMLCGVSYTTAMNATHRYLRKRVEENTTLKSKV